MKKIIPILFGLSLTANAILGLNLYSTNKSLQETGTALSSCIENNSYLERDKTSLEKKLAERLLDSDQEGLCLGDVDLLAKYYRGGSLFHNDCMDDRYDFDSDGIWDYHLVCNDGTIYAALTSKQKEGTHVSFGEGKYFRLDENWHKIRERLHRFEEFY